MTQALLAHPFAHYLFRFQVSNMKQRGLTERQHARVVHRLLLLSITAVVSACVTTDSPSRSTGAPPPETITQTYQRVISNRQNTVMPLTDSTRVVIEADDAVYLFTNASHPAHSSYLYTRHIKKEDGWIRITTGYSEGDADAYDQWLREHQRHDGVLHAK